MEGHDQFLVGDDEVVDMDKEVANGEDSIEEDADKEPDSDIEATDEEEIEEVDPSDEDDDE